MAQSPRVRNLLVAVTCPVLAVAGAAALGAQQPAPRAAAARQSQAVELRPGTVITRSVRVARQTWRLATDVAHDSGHITIRGNDITLDLGGATLEGMPAGNDPDMASGVAIRVEGGRNIRIVNGRIRGFKVAILARNTTNLVIERVDASNNWKPRLFSLVEHESLVDWLSFHRNESDEWLRFGAAFYLHGVTGGAVRQSRAEQGMNALLMVKTERVTVTDNDFSFNSGLGIGLYRSSRNTIVRNRVDFNVRGYSHGFYRRGQDSAGILLYEQSSDNVIAFNSATHGGDGFFLWAGQSTMDTGEGGANDNWLIGNDFSWAPANGIEATFSRNHMVGNRLEGNDYGVWGGYSYSSTIRENCFLRNRIGIAIEHGQDNVIASNTFFGDTTAISLWANPIEPSDWMYPRRRDTRSRDYQVTGNTFRRHRVVLRAVNTAGLTMRTNRVSGVDSLAVLRDTSRFTMDAGEPPAGRGTRLQPLPGECTLTRALDAVPAAIRSRMGTGGVRPPFQLPLQPLGRRDRSAMVVDEWGPFDWKSPKLWPLDSVRSTPLRLRVLGPTGRWRVVAQRGIASLSRMLGSTGDTIAIVPAPEASADWAIELEYTGGATRTPRGQAFGPGARYRFGYERFEPRQDWNVRFFTWSDSTARDSAGPAATRALAGTPAVARSASRLDYFWYRPAIRELPQARWALDATATVNLPPGEYTLRTISDDGIRVWVDGVLVIDRWTHHESTVDNAALTGGRHALRVQYFQDDGWTELRLDIVKGVVRSTGSAGPH
jgi:parallel beta-helix repeat protein